MDVDGDGEFGPGEVGAGVWGSLGADLWPWWGWAQAPLGASPRERRPERRIVVRLGTRPLFCFLSPDLIFFTVFLLHGFLVVAGGTPHEAPSNKS